jgi:hypothetical protein
MRDTQGPEQSPRVRFREGSAGVPALANEHLAPGATLPRRAHRLTTAFLVRPPRVGRFADPAAAAALLLLGTTRSFGQRPARDRLATGAIISSVRAARSKWRAARMRATAQAGRDKGGIGVFSVPMLGVATASRMCCAGG